MTEKFKNFNNTHMVLAGFIGAANIAMVTYYLNNLSAEIRSSYWFLLPLLCFAFSLIVIISSNLWSLYHFSEESEALPVSSTKRMNKKLSNYLIFSYVFFLEGIICIVAYKLLFQVLQ